MHLQQLYSDAPATPLHVIHIITLGKFLKCSVGFREFWCTTVHDYRAI